MKITLGKIWIGNKAILRCVKCVAWTVHALSSSGKYYSCGCGEQIYIEFSDDEENENGNEN